MSDEVKKVKKIKLNSDVIEGISQLDNSEFSSQAVNYSGGSQDTSKAGGSLWGSQDTSKAGCSPCDSQDQELSRDEFIGSDGSDLVAGQELKVGLDSSADSSPRHHKPAHSGEDFDLPSNERSVFNRNLKASLVAKDSDQGKLSPSE